MSWELHVDAGLFALVIAPRRACCQCCERFQQSQPPGPAQDRASAFPMKHLHPCVVASLDSDCKKTRRSFALKGRTALIEKQAVCDAVAGKAPRHLSASTTVVQCWGRWRSLEPLQWHSSDSTLYSSSQLSVLRSGPSCFDLLGQVLSRARTPKAHNKSITGSSHTVAPWNGRNVLQAAGSCFYDPAEGVGGLIEASLPVYLLCNSIVQS